MKTKKSLLWIASVLLLTVLCCCFLIGCKSTAEKETEYYDGVKESVEKHTDTLTSLTEKVFQRAWTANFMYAYTYYRKTNDDNTFVNDCITRGTDKNAGWPSGASEYVHFIYYEIDYDNADNYTIKSTSFEDTDRKNYYDNKDKPKNYDKKFKKTGQLTYQMKNGVQSGELTEGLHPLELIKANTDKEKILKYGISASDHFRIYTHFMRIESRQVYDADRAVIDKARNDESKQAYWTNYGEDISYNWDKVYGMDNSRLTVLYSKGKSRINSLEIYNEEVISYYTKKDKVNTQLVLKADVVRYCEAVVEFDYK